MIRKVIDINTVPRMLKGWGYENWIHNDADYCGKELVLHWGMKCSIHYHKIKKETFYVISGHMVVDLFDRPFEVKNGNLLETIESLVASGLLKGETVNMTVGDSLLIEPGTPHRFLGIAEETRFMEFSTTHKEEDSYRIWPGDSQTNG